MRKESAERVEELRKRVEDTCVRVASIRRARARDRGVEVYDFDVRCLRRRVQTRRRRDFGAHGRMGQCFASPVPSLPCANGTLALSSRVQTQYTLDEGGDGLWYTGTIQALWDNGECSIKYDDGDKWTGRSVYAYLLPAGSPGLSQLQPYGAQGQGGYVQPPLGRPGEPAVAAQAVPVVVLNSDAATLTVVGRRV